MFSSFSGVTTSVEGNSASSAPSIQSRFDSSIVTDSL
jgi:hypothetical protein